MTARVRVVITGLGAISPLGVGVAVLWEGLLAGRSGIRDIEAFDTAAYDTHRGGEVPNFIPTEKFGGATQFAIACGHQALADASLVPDGSDRVGLCLGTTMGEIREIEASCASDTAWGRYPASLVGTNTARALGLGGPNLVIPTACAAANYSIGHAVDLLRDGRADAMLAGGVDVMAETQFSGFSKLRSMAPDVPRPFSADRQGMMVAEGGGMLLLERLDDAQARGARIYCEVLGHGLSCDAHHMTSPHPDGTGALEAMRAALDDADVFPGAIDYINAHGTGTAANDKIETLAIKQLLGYRAAAVPVTSIKSMLGHAMGAASALEAIVTALILHHGKIPPTAHYSGPDPDCDLDYVVEGQRAAAIGVALSNSYAFGGNNACLVLCRL